MSNRDHDTVYFTCYPCDIDMYVRVAHDFCGELTFVCAVCKRYYKTEIECGRYNVIIGLVGDAKEQKRRHIEMQEYITRLQVAASKNRVR